MKNINFVGPFKNLRVMKNLMLFFVLLSGIPVTAQDMDFSKYPLIQIKDMKTIIYDTFRVEAMVREIVICQPCPKNARCKPCLGDHLNVGTDMNSENEEIIIFLKRPDEFVKSEKYNFILRMKDRLHPERGTVFIAAERLKK